MRYINVTARESTVNKELCRGYRALQAVGISENLLIIRTLIFLDQPLLCQPLARVMAHIDFQYTAFGGELTARYFPGWPGFFGCLS